MNTMREIFTRLYLKLKFPDDKTVRQGLKLLVLSALIPSIYSLKSSERNTKFNLSVSRWCSRIYGNAFRFQVPLN